MEIVLKSVMPASETSNITAWREVTHRFCREVFVSVAVLLKTAAQVERFVAAESSSSPKKRDAGLAQRRRADPRPYPNRRDRDRMFRLRSVI
ncbi:MAG TPA: hypothetical protein VHY80_00995 [Stellaceae bacterium]|nr:hypothetical protein [Stellaceae bacterium]